MSKKLIVSVIVAVFCTTAFAGIMANSDADGGLTLTSESEETKKYAVYLTIIEDNLTDFEVNFVEFTCNKNAEAWCSSFNEKTADLDGNFKNIKAAYDSVTSTIIVEYGTSVSWVKTDGKWINADWSAKKIIEASEADFELKNGLITEAQYKSLSEREQKLWTSDGLLPPSYLRNATGKIIEDAFEILLIVGAVILIVIVLVVILVVLHMRKKGQQSA